MSMPNPPPSMACTSVSSSTTVRASPLRRDSVAQFESRFALHNSAFALNDRELTNVVDIYLHHDFLQFLEITKRLESTNRAIPVFCASWVADQVADWKFRRGTEQICATGNTVLALSSW
jgi:hypothetical protein